MSDFDSRRLRERARWTQWVLVGAFAILLGAFFRLQVIQHERYRLRAEHNRIRPVPLTPPRGLILDRHGEVIAENVPGFAVKLLASSEDSLRSVLRRVRQIVDIDSSLAEQVVRRFRRAPHLPVVLVADGSFEMVSRLEEHRSLLPGLVIESEPKRWYPDGPTVAHLIGFIGEVSERDLDQGRYPGADPGTLVGRSGLEEEYDQQLRGRPGVRYIEVSAGGQLVREEGVAPAVPPVSGTAVTTTVDLGLQRFVDSLWQADLPGVRGGLVALTPAGEVLALYSSPSFDPNMFIGGISREDWQVLRADSTHPLINRVIQARYPPASPFKLAIAAMALRKGVVDYRSRMSQPCRGGIQLGNRFFRCWKREGHGSLDLVGAIEKSCDVYFYQLGARLGIDAILSEGVSLGFRDRSGIDLPGEMSPIFPASTAYFDRAYGPRGWSRAGAEFNFAIGQGENTQTLINMVKFYQALAGTGAAIPPHLVGTAAGQPRDLALAPEVLEVLRRAMLQVVETGTAVRSRQAGLKVGGKTGTAQNAHGDDHGWFVGFGPVEQPQIIVGAIMEYAKHGSAVAPYVVKTLRRFVLGPEAASDKALDRLSQEAPQDTAPRWVPISPDSAVTPLPTLPAESTYAPVVPLP
ncbi:MAG TPA: penicillin-binding protein 2 [Gemmatimonadales bacterium]|nr:penicillin-binding protein 2 [Gemmatimonadales bacterium]